MEIKFNNPFLVATLIVIVLNVMVFMFFRPKVKSKIYFRSLFYMWIVTTGIFYYYHTSMEEEMKKKLNAGVNMNLINKPPVEEIKPQLSENDQQPLNVFVEESLI